MPIFAASADDENRSFSIRNFVLRKLSKWKLCVRKLLSLVHRTMYYQLSLYMLRDEGCREISVRHVSTGDDFINSSRIIYLVPFLATKETLVPLANDPIMYKRLIRSFKHLECQNLSILLVSKYWRRRVPTEGGEKSGEQWTEEGGWQLRVARNPENKQEIWRTSKKSKQAQNSENNWSY